MRSARPAVPAAPARSPLPPPDALTAPAACGTSSSDNDGGGASSGERVRRPVRPLDPKTKVTLTIDCMPPAAKAAELKEGRGRRRVQQDVPERHHRGPLDPGQCLEPPRFTAMLKAKSQPDVFYTYFTDPPQVLSPRPAPSDISAYVNDKTVPLLGDISDPNVLGSSSTTAAVSACPPATTPWGCWSTARCSSAPGST